MMLEGTMRLELHYQKSTTTFSLSIYKPMRPRPRRPPNPLAEFLVYTLTLTGLIMSMAGIAVQSGIVGRL